MGDGGQDLAHGRESLTSRLLILARAKQCLRRSGPVLAGTAPSPTDRLKNSVASL